MDDGPRARRFYGEALGLSVWDEMGGLRERGPTIAWFTDPAGNILSVLQDD